MSSHVGFPWVWRCQFWWACLRGNVDFDAPTLGIILNFSTLKCTYHRYNFQFFGAGAHFRGPTLGVNLICALPSSYKSCFTIMVSLYVTSLEPCHQILVSRIWGFLKFHRWRITTKSYITVMSYLMLSYVDYTTSELFRTVFYCYDIIIHQIYHTRVSTFIQHSATLGKTIDFY